MSKLSAQSSADYVALEEDEESGNVEEVIIVQEPPPPPPPPPIPKGPSRWSVWLDRIRTEFNLPKISSMRDLKKYTKTRQFKNSFKSTLAIVFSSLFSLIAPVEEIIGPTGFMISIAVLQFDLTVTLGGLLENFIIILLCVCVPSVLAYTALHISLHSSLALLCWAFGYYFTSMWLKTFMAPRWQVPISIGQEVYMFCLVLGFRTFQFTGIDQSGMVVFGLAKNSIIGATLSLLFTAILFPHSATKALRSEMMLALKHLPTLLELNSKMIFNEATAQECLALKQLLSASIKKIPTMTTLCQDVEMEINQSLLSAKEYNKALKILKRLFRHLSAMSRAGTSLHEAEEHPPDSKPAGFSLTRSLNLRRSYVDTSIVDILSSLRAPIATLNFCCLEVIQKSCNKFDNNPTELQHMMDRLEGELDVFDINLQSIIGDVFHNAQHDEAQAEKLHRVYCFLFSLREFVYDLYQLVNCLNSSENETRINCPSYYRRIENFFMSISISDIRESEVEIGNGLQTGSAEDRKSWGYTLWKLSTKVATPSTSFAFRTALLILLASIPAFLPETKQLYKDWRGEWVVFTIIVSVSPSFAADAVNAKWRATGTIFGAIFAVLFTEMCGHNPFLIFLSVAVFVFPVNFVRLASAKYQKLTMIAIFTFLLVVLGKYTGQFKEEIWLVATRRALTICLGVTLVMLFSRLFWPLLARRELRLQLSSAVHDVALLYSKTISLFLNENKQLRDVRKLEDSLQVSVLRMQGLLDQAKVEPRIKGVFPIQVYADLLQSVQTSSDILLSIRLLIVRGFSGKLRETIVVPLNHYRKELVISILTVFWIVGESLNSKRPVPHHVQNSKHALKRMSNAFRKLMQHKQTLKREQPSNDIILFSAYLKLLKDFVIELNQIVECTKKLFGDSQFIEGLFVEDKFSFRASGEHSPPSLSNNNNHTYDS